MISCANHSFDPQNSELETCDFLLREEIDKRMDDNKLAIPNDQVIANIDALLDKLTGKTA